MKQLIIIFIVGIAFALIGSNLNDSLLGKPPVKKFEASLEDNITDPVLDALRKAAETSPNEIAAWRALANTLKLKIQNSGGEDRGLILEAIDVYSNVLKLAPEDSEALLSLADLSFDERVFDKSKEFYVRYLTKNPDDHSARAKYGSTLTFLGELDQAEKELRTVIKKEPKSFHAHAYLAIALSEKGDLKEAKKIGDIALELAPKPEARERLAAFLQSLATPQDPLSLFYQKLKQNPVAGPKFQGGELANKTLKLSFKDFPMSNMPPFAKEKFFNSIKQLMPKNTAAKVEFIDLETGKVMESLALD